MDRAAVDYHDKRALVIGGATGMGAATARLLAHLGAQIVVMDVAAIDYHAQQYQAVDLSDKSSVDHAMAAIEGSFDAVFACAGVADGTRGLMQINFISQRHIIDQLLSSGRLGPGAAVVLVSSIAGLPWQTNLAQLMDFLSHTTWEAAEAWLSTHDGTDNYSFSKQAVNAYTAAAAMPMMTRGVRINAILPGPTDTPLARANADVWFGFASQYRKATGVACLVPEQMASVMAFLASPAASGINGVTLPVDQGHVSAALTGVHPEPALQMMFP